MKMCQSWTIVGSLGTLCISVSEYKVVFCIAVDNSWKFSYTFEVSIKIYIWNYTQNNCPHRSHSDSVTV